MLLDSAIVLSAIYISLFTLHPHIEIFKYPALLLSAVTLLVSHHIFAFHYRLYHKMWEYASIGELIAIAKTVTFSIIVTAVVQWAIYQDMYVRALMITWMIHMLLLGGSRFVWRIYRDQYMNQNKGKKRTLIIGAGAAGMMVARQLLTSRESDLCPIAFIDDDRTKQKLHILGIPVAGTTKDIAHIVQEKRIEHIIIAIPSLKKQELNRIFAECAKTNAKTQTVPKLEDIMSGKVSVNQFRDVQVEDLLGRDPIQLDTNSISHYIEGKVILVTGAGGSIGSEICRQVCRFHPKKIILLGHGENSIYQIDMELRNKYKHDIDIVPIIGDIQDRERMFEVMEQHRPHVVYHAAAHKHVPLMEYNPKEAVKNNIFGTKNVAEAAATFSVGTFVLVSTDKAVNPTNVMGATKRFAEMIIQQLDKQSNTKFVAVRFGNVLGSRGSVIPLFKKQIQAGGPVTVTHPDMTRYFMTIPEASQLVIQAGALAKGGEIFVLDMGEPVKIVDLAKNLIKLSGYTIDEIGIEFTGIRPGEKMFEELLNENEVHPEQVFPKIFVGKATVVERSVLQQFIEKFPDMGSEQVRFRLLEITNCRHPSVSDYQTVINH